MTNNWKSDGSCKYCGIMYYELRSEGAPCGINDCSIWTCCEKSFKEHAKVNHPEWYYAYYEE